MQNPVDVLWIARYDYKPGWRVSPHSHDFFQLLCSLEGSGTIALPEGERDFAADELMLLAPGVEHGIAADREVPLRTLDTKFRILDSDLEKGLRSLSWPRADKEHRVQHILERMRLEGMRRNQWYRQLCNALLLEGLIALLRREAVAAPTGSESDLRDPILSGVEAYLGANYAGNITVRDIAAHLGYSPEYLSRCFRRSAGVPLHAHLMKRRIEKAKEMLTYSEAPIKEVAERTGFKSVHHFSRAFKERHGVPPGEFRRRERSGVWKNVVISPGFVNEDFTVTPEGSSNAPPPDERTP